MIISGIEARLALLVDEVDDLEKALVDLIRVKKKMSDKLENLMELNPTNQQLQQTPIAIIGMASVFPKAENLQEYWENILNEVDCITDVPSSHWDVDDHYDANPRAKDKTYSKRGGFIPKVDFNSLEFGLPPNLLEVTDVSQLLSLVVAKKAMEDAGYGQSRDFNRDSTGVILGAALGRQSATPFSSRLQHPIWRKVLKNSGLSDEDTEKIVEKIKAAYVEWDENAFPGLLANVISGRITNRLDLGGTNCVIDAACASSLAAMRMAATELLTGQCDMILTGGVDIDNSIFTYLCFSKTPALSLKQQTRPFDVDADGMMLGEGIGMVVLKRLTDAQRDGDKIYAVIKAIGTSSDGKFKSIYAPRPEGQVKALRSAYQNAGVCPTSVGLIEAHGTGTMAGDPAEFKAIKEFFGENNANKQHIALGSVKSQIGHTKAAAGAASLIKTALALHHKVLPPTINITKPNPKLNIEDSPFYLNTKARPWIRGAGQEPRRAGVSSFGFGGTNYHVILEEYQEEQHQPYRIHSTPQPVLLHAPTPTQLLSKCEEVLGQLQSDSGKQHYAELSAASKSVEIPVTSARVGFVASSLTQAGKKLQTTIDWLKNKPQLAAWEHPQGLFYRQTGLDPQAKVVALFSGQGSQYLNMGRELAINFPVARQLYSYIDSLLVKDGLKPLSEVVFPKPVFEPAQEAAQFALLQRTEYAQPAIGALSVAMYKILQQTGFKPDFVAGHSFGELTALWAGGVLTDEDYFFLVKSRGQAMATPDDPNLDAGAMLAVKGDVSKVESLIQQFPQVSIANINSPQQIVLAGPKSEVTKVQEALNNHGYQVVLLPVSAAFHTPMVAHCQEPFARAVKSVMTKSAGIPIYTNVTGDRYPTKPQSIQKNLEEHLRSPVFFKQEIENIYANGGYYFVEFGPRSILTHLVKDILGDKPHMAVSLNASRQKDSDQQLREAVMQLRVAGLSLQDPDPYQLEYPVLEPQKPLNSKLTFRLDGVNQVSEKTKKAFETALQDGHKITSAAIASEATPQPEVAPPVQETPQPEPSSITQSTSSLVMNFPVTPSKPMQTQPMTELSMNYQRVLESFEYSLAQFNQHQGETLQVHGQYLNHQMEYAKIFFQLMQQQGVLFTQAGDATKPAQAQLAVMESLERSMMKFQEHQAATLRVHEQSLNHQIEYAKHFFHLTQQQYAMLMTRGSTQYHLGMSEGVADLMDTQSSSSVALPNGKAISTSELAVSQPEKVSSNGHGSKPTATAVMEMVAPAPEKVSSNGNGSKPAATAVPEMVAPAPEKVSSNGNGSKPAATAVPEMVAPAPEKVSSNGNGFKPAPTAVPEMVAPAPEKVSSNGNGSKPAATTPTPPVVAETAAIVDSSAIGIDITKLSETLLEVVADKTGYPPEMLELEMDMEADLGIDSIKRVEIMGAMQDQFPELPKPNLEELAEIEMRTLSQVVDFMKQLSQGEAKKKELQPA